MYYYNTVFQPTDHKIQIKFGHLIGSYSSTTDLSDMGHRTRGKCFA